MYRSDCVRELVNFVLIISNALCHLLSNNKVMVSRYIHRTCNPFINEKARASAVLHVDSYSLSAVKVNAFCV